jgi:hypothetical protein
VRLDVHNLETTDQAKDGGKKSFEVPSAREKVKDRGQGTQSAGCRRRLAKSTLIELGRDMVHRGS